MRLIVAVAKIAFYCVAGAALTLLVVFVRYLDARPDLEAWHTARLDEEFDVDSPVETFEEYLALEDRLFAQLDNLVYAKTAPTSGFRINRYQRGSLADPQRWPINWNRSYLLPAESPRMQVLLVHGLSDAPYSLHHLGERLQSAGANVLGLRVPGHGTAPSGLVEVTWQDMAAAVRLALDHLARNQPELPIYIVGYSNGAALAVHYALANLDAPEAPRLAGLVLYSPEIGVTPAAALAVWQARLGHLPGLEKLAWNDILPEYEPFKYGSFAINAGDVSYRITAQIQEQIMRLKRGPGGLRGMPPILAFSSVIDATVQAPALVSHLFSHLPAGRNELVLFDINRQAGIEEMLRWRPDAMLKALREAPGDTFDFTLVANESAQSSRVVARHWQPEHLRFADEALDLSWPPDVYSLSHVALPFPPDDPVYGSDPDQPSPGIALGDIALRGEKGALAISESTLLRLRWNPFYSYLEARSLAFLGLE
ncbi:alpha/beta hydrolase [Haliea sp. E17]|uniref:alpha/beta hydrolase n=1 Tax=Haliea sp. E17 TaxID=3401576 RepID=UPI003AAA8628